MTYPEVLKLVDNTLRNFSIEFTTKKDKISGRKSTLFHIPATSMLQTTIEDLQDSVNDSRVLQWLPEAKVLIVQSWAPKALA